ncbi:hypothetical protein C7H19_24320 [Aphanothece hegewaldii CCALA 016]|uniref:Uncharacterized protein n=1 Tax=Aphanothece hegewaldii CCALA 016 TaxID=2107694 RepID=A0A2T1LQT8_9CHRO|nr:hypothetical protein [Aphanothece hegewaldii]PSF29448.1 hypothetical protein C7H19_24320 [Aphanothece hegewaldii CCALA 016]
MVSPEILTNLRKLNRADKLYVIQVLVSELAQKEEDLIKGEQSYPVWSPIDAFEAADVMLKVLEDSRSKK